MQLADLITTISSQIPVVAVDVLSPEEGTIIQWITQQVTSELELPVYFWNLGVSTLEQALIASDGGLTFKLIDTYKKPPPTDPLLFVFEYIQSTSSDGVFILGDVHPFIGKDSPTLSWEVLTRVKNLYHRLKPTDKRIILLGQGIQLHESLIRLIPCAEVPLPCVEQVLDHLSSYLPYLEESATAQDVNFKVSLTPEEWENLARAALGLTLEEISDFLRLSIRKRLTPSGIVIDAASIAAVAEYKTRLLSQMGIELGKPANIPFGGLDLFREWLMRRRRLFTEQARQYNLPKPKGVLLAGPPGVGKSLIAKNIASILNLPLLKLDIAGMLGSLVGQSEGNVKRALKTAEAIQPCALWIDEVDKALSGSGDTSGVSQRILGTILSFMQESEGGVFVIATCNDVTALPSEFKRKGRFDENFFVDLPTASERGVILKIHLQRFGCSVPDEYLEAIAAATEKFSGSELENLASEAATLAFDNGHPQQITLTELEASRAAITPLAIQDAAAVERMQEWARTARPASSPALDTSSSQSLRTPKLRKL